MHAYIWVNSHVSDVPDKRYVANMIKIRSVHVQILSFELPV